MTKLSAAVATGILALSVLAGRAAEGSSLAWVDEYLNEGRYSEAAEILRKGLEKLEKGSPGWLQVAPRLVSTLRIVGGYAEAKEIAQAAAEAAPKDPAIQGMYAEVLHETGDYPKSLEIYDKLIEADPKNYRAWGLRVFPAEVLGKKDVLKKTADLFFDLFNANSESYHEGKVEDPMEMAYVGLGIKRENPKDAFEVGFQLTEKVLLKSGAKNPEPFLWSAELSYEKYAFGYANERYKEVLQMRPKLPDALSGQAKVLLTYRHDVKGAEPFLKQALEVNPNHIESHLILAEIAMTDDEFDEAKKHIDAALKVNPNHLDALAMLAFYHHDLNQAEKEKEIEAQVLGISPKHAEYYCRLGELIEDKRGFDEAPAFYRKAIDLDPDYWRGYYGLGMNTSRQGAHGEQEGKRLLLKAFEMNRFNLWASNMIRVLDKVIGDEAQQVPPKYAESRTEHFILKFYNKETEIVRPYLEEWAEQAYAYQTEKFGFKPEGPLTIELCYTFQDQAARTVGLPNLGALGVCFGKLCTVVSPREGKGAHPPFNWKKVLEHEFCHVMTLQMSGYRVPRWYTEAFSTYIENDSRLNSDGMMVNYIANNQLKPLDKMNEYFRENMLMAYVHGRYIIEYIDKEFGFEAHRKALKLFAEGQKVNEVLPEVTGKPLKELDAGCMAFVKDFFATKVRLRPQYDEADLARLETAASRPEASAQEIADLALAHLAKRQVQRAVAGAQKALQLDPKNPDALNLLGVVEMEKKDYQKAKELFEQSTQVAPEKSFTAWHNLGVIYNKEGRTTKAVEALEKARALYPRYVGPENPHHLLPELYMDMEPPQPEKAMQVWLDAIAANTEDVEAAMNGLKHAMEIKNYQAAVACAEAHIAIDPYQVKVHHLAGEAYGQLKDLKRAAREYRVATALDEKDVDSWVKLARLEIQLGNREAAREAVGKALEVDGTHEGAKALRAEMGM